MSPRISAKVGAVPSLVSQSRFCLPCIVLAALGVSHAQADQRVDAPKPAAAVTTATLGLLNPVALLGQAIASLLGSNTELSALGADGRYAASLAASLPPGNDLAVRFAASPKHSRVSLLLAESQVHVRLAQDLLLRCEVSSRDDANADAELKFDLGVQFKFK